MHINIEKRRRPEPLKGQNKEISNFLDMIKKKWIFHRKVSFLP